MALTNFEIAAQIARLSEKTLNSSYSDWKNFYDCEETKNVSHFFETDSKESIFLAQVIRYQLLNEDSLYCQNWCEMMQLDIEQFSEFDKILMSLYEKGYLKLFNEFPGYPEFLKMTILPTSHVIHAVIRNDSDYLKVFECKNIVELVEKYIKLVGNYQFFPGEIKKLEWLSKKLLNTNPELPLLEYLQKQPSSLVYFFVFCIYQNIQKDSPVNLPSFLKMIQLDLNFSLIWKTEIEQSIKKLIEDGWLIWLPPSEDEMDLVGYEITDKTFQLLKPHQTKKFGETKSF